MSNYANLEKHFVASGFVLNQDQTKMLMVYHRKLDKWAAPGGHLEANEFPVDGMRREVKEETGLDVRPRKSSNQALIPFKAGETDEQEMIQPYVMLQEYIPERKDKPAHYHMDFVFVCQADDTAPLKQQEEEVKKVAWLTWEEIIACNTFPSIKEFAERMK